ncbi:MAG: cytochrome P450, partial [Solirubrobacteraceae bacterium]
EVLCMMIGVSPDHIPIFERATIDISLMKADPLEPGIPRLREALQTLKDYGTALVDNELETPKGGFVDALRSDDGEGRLSREEQIWQIAGLLFTGHDTTRFALAAAVRDLVEQGAWAEVAADPALIPAAVDESFRWSPTAMVVTRKVVADDVVLDGVPIPPDTLLRFNMFAVHRDPERFDRPNVFDLHRTEGRGVFPFGMGRHKCIGHLLARTDIETALAVLMQRIASPRFAAPVVMSPFTWALGGPEHVPVAFDPA